MQSTPLKILLLGAHGQVGHELLRVLQPLGQLQPLTRRPLAGWPDAQRSELVQAEHWPALWREIAPDIIVNAAAWTAVDAAESEPGAAALVNHQLPASLAAYAAERGARLVHFSTDYVFSGEADAAQQAYRESDPVAPASVYGRTKLAGERAVLDSGADALVIRTSWVYSGRRHNFVRAMLQRIRHNEPLRVVDDQIGCPTWARDLADGIGYALRRWPAADREPDGSLYHLAGAERSSWYQFARRIADAGAELGLLTVKPSIAPICSAEYPTPAPRPAWSVLDSSRFAQQFGYRAAGWSALHACLEELNEARCWFP